jgi:hypothetical protein
LLLPWVFLVRPCFRPYFRLVGKLLPNSFLLLVRANSSFDEICPQFLYGYFLYFLYFLYFTDNSIVSPSFNLPSEEHCLFKGIIRELLDLIGLEGFVYMYSPTNIFHDIFDGSCMQ